MGIPAVPLITQRFQELVTSISYKKGIPNMRITYTPHPITDRPADVCRKYVAGNDPLTGKPMLDEMLAAKAAAFKALGLEVSVCGSEHGLGG